MQSIKLIWVIFSLISILLNCQCCKFKQGNTQAIVAFSKGKTGYFLIKLNERRCPKEDKNFAQKANSYYIFLSENDSIICTSLKYSSYDTVYFKMFEIDESWEELRALKFNEINYKLINESNKTCVVGYIGPGNDSELDSTSILSIIRKAYP